MDEYLETMSRQYATGDTPWDTGIPSEELVRALDEGQLPGTTLLEMGCGTGTNAVELARRGYRVTAVDLIELAVQRAREKAHHTGVNVDVHVGDLTRIDLGGPYDCLFDLGLYHGIRGRNLNGFLATLQRISRTGTRWLCLAGNAKEPWNPGPPVVHEREIRAELEPLFQILSLREFRFELRPDFRPLAWSVLMERR